MQIADSSSRKSTVLLSHNSCQHTCQQICHVEPRGYTSEQHTVVRSLFANAVDVSKDNAK